MKLNKWGSDENKKTIRLKYSCRQKIIKENCLCENLNKFDLKASVRKISAGRRKI